MQKTYVSALGTKYADFGFSKEVFDRVALQRLKTIGKAEEIESDVASPDVLLLLMKEMQGSNDVLRTKVTQTQKELDDLKKNQPNNQTTQTQQEPESELAKQLQTLTELVTTMQTERAAEKKKAQADAIISQVHAKMKSMGCTNEYIRTATLAGITIGDNDTADSLAERYKSAYDANCKAAFGDGYIPPKGGINGGDEIDFSAMVAGLQASGDLPK